MPHHPFVLRPMDLMAQQQEQIHHHNNNVSGSSRRGDVPPASVPPLGPAPHHFHGPPPPGWMEAHPRGQAAHPRAPPPASNNNCVAGHPRRSPRGNPAFRFDFAPPHHMHPHHARHPSGPGGGPGGGSGAGGCGGSGPGGPPPGQHHLLSQQRGVPSPRGGPVGAARGPPPAMRPLPTGASGPRRRPEHLHLVGPLGDPMFVGSPTACGSGVGAGCGGCGGDGNNAGMETVSRVLIPNCKIGAVIGKGGAIIKHIREVRYDSIHSAFTAYTDTSM